MKQLPIYFLFLFLLAFKAVSQDYPEAVQANIKQVENGLSPAVRFKDEPTWTLDERMTHYKVPAVSIALIKDYKIEWVKVYGYADSERQLPATTETGFQAASISKTINAVGFLNWVQKENMDLDKDINELLTSWKFPYDDKTGGKIITSKQLLSHTAGVSVHGFPGYKDAKNLPTAVQIVLGEKPANNGKVTSLFPPGETFKYAGGGTTISQVILMDQTNMPYQEYMRQNVLNPLNMDNSFYYMNVRDNVAKGHFNSGKQRKNGYNTYPELAAAGFWTTPTDLAKLIIELQLSLKGESEKVLSKVMVELMTTPANDGQTNALGTFIEPHGDLKYFSHGGSNEGFKCQYYGSLEGGHGVVVMVNSDHFDIITEIIRSVSVVYGWPLQAPLILPEKITVTDKVLATYTGTYVSTKEPTRSITISLKKGKFSAEEKGRWQAGLIATGETEFITKDINPAPTFRFVSNEQGKVIKMVTEQSGLEHEWMKKD